MKPSSLNPISHSHTGSSGSFETDSHGTAMAKSPTTRSYSTQIGIGSTQITQDEGPPGTQKIKKSSKNPRKRHSPIDMHAASGPRGLLTVASSSQDSTDVAISADHSTGSDDFMRGSVSCSSFSTRESNVSIDTKTDDISPGHWANKAELILTILAYVGGFGDAWNFPYLSLKYGQGTFILLFLAFHLIIALPLVYLELLLGQYSSMSPVRVFANMVPVFRGIGWASISVVIVRSIYYNVIMAWATFYLCANVVYPWDSCNNTFNTECCLSKPRASPNPNCTSEPILNQLSSYQLFYNFMYNYTADIPGVGNPQWQLTFALLFCWLLTLACVIRGVNSFGIIVYFSSTIPLMILLAVAIFSTTLPDAASGIRYLLTPNGSAFSDPLVWTHAGIHVLFSVSPAFGVWITLGSYNRFHNNCFRDALVAVASNAAISLLSGLTLSSVLGFTGAAFNASYADLVGDAGRDMAFVIYPVALVQQPSLVKYLFNILFFIMLVFIGLNTQFIQIEVLVVAFCDQWPKLRKYRWAVAIVVCFVLFLFGIPMCTEQGLSLFTTVVDYADAPLMYIALLELVSVIYIYGWRRVYLHICRMIKQSQKLLAVWFGSSGKIMQWLWFALCPIMLVLFLALYFVPYNEKFKSSRLNLFGAFIFFLPLMVICSMSAWLSIVHLCRRRSLVGLFKPSDQWCPAHKRPRRPKRERERSKSATLTLDGVRGSVIKRY